MSRRTLTWADWTDRAAADLEEAFTPAELCATAAAVQDGRELLFALLEGGRRVGSVVVRLEDGAEGRELVCVGVGGQPGILGRFQAPLEAWGRSRGAATMRAHCRAPGMVRMLPRHGFAAVETVFRKDL